MGYQFDVKLGDYANLAAVIATGTPSSVAFSDIQDNKVFVLEKVFPPLVFLTRFPSLSYAKSTVPHDRLTRFKRRPSPQVNGTPRNKVGFPPAS